MKSLLILSLTLLTSIGAMASNIKVQKVSYNADGVMLNGYVAYDESISGLLPVVLVVHEWWGCNDYAVKRATMLAELGYFAFAVDMYGNGKTTELPSEAQQLATVLYQDPELAKKRINAAIKELDYLTKADAERIAAVGYCFGGSMVLNAAKMGLPLKGVVSFHGGLAGVPASKETLKAKILVCHGGADPFVSAEEVSNFRKNLDSIGADYTFTIYEGATHAFTNENSTEVGKKFGFPLAYHPEADKNSWLEMKSFLADVFK